MAQKREKEETEVKIPETLSPAAEVKILPQRSRRSDLGLKRPREASRCSGLGCRKVIGFMGFRCRCGDVFCGEHRYSDRHDCSYDYKAAGREAITRENPVVRAPKLLKV